MALSGRPKFINCKTKIGISNVGKFFTGKEWNEKRTVRLRYRKRRICYKKLEIKNSKNDKREYPENCYIC